MRFFLFAAPLKGALGNAKKASGIREIVCGIVTFALKRDVL